MTTMSDLVPRLRVDLHDEDSSAYRWQDTTLERHIERAARELSQVWPRERVTTLQTSAGSRDVDISGALTDLVRIEAVEWPAGEYPPCYVQWALYQDTLTLLTEEAPAAAEDVNVYWGSLHTVDATLSTLPAQAEEAVLTGAAGYAALEWANFAINRANLAGPETVDDYRKYADERLQRFHDLLGELGRRSRVRLASLFTPARDAAGRNVVRWET